MLFIKHLLINKIVIRPALPREKKSLYKHTKKKNLSTSFAKKFKKISNWNSRSLNFVRAHTFQKNTSFLSVKAF